MTKQEQLDQYLEGSTLCASIANNIDIYMINESTILILDHELKGFTIWEANTNWAVSRLYGYLHDIYESDYNDEQNQCFDAMEYWLAYSKEISLYKRIMF